MTVVTDGQAIMQRKRATVGYFFAFISLGIATAALGPTLPGLAEQTGVQLKQVSYLFVTRSFGYLVGSLVGGRLYDRLSGHRMLRGILLFMGTTLVLVPGMRWLPLLTVLLLLVGVGEGALDVGCNTLILWQYRRASGPYLNGLHFFFGLGAFLAPLLVAVFLPTKWGLTGAYWSLGVLALPGFFLLNGVASPAPPPVEASRPEGIARPDLVLGTLLLLALYVGAESGFGGWIYAYGLSQGIPATMAAGLNSAYWGALTLGRLASVPLAARLRPSRFLGLDYGICLASILIVGLAGLPILAAWAGILLWTGTLGLGLGMASIFPTAIAMAERRMRLSGAVTGWFLVGAALGGMSLPWLVGQFFESYGPFSLVVGVGGVLVLGVVVLVWLLQRSGPEQSENVQS